VKIISKNSTSNATLDQLLKSLDDINLYLEKNYPTTTTTTTKQKQYSPVNNRFKTFLKNSESLADFNILKKSTKDSILKLPVKAAHENRSYENKLSPGLNKYSYLNFNKNRPKELQNRKQMSIEM
jgi:hypothetical protein